MLGSLIVLFFEARSHLVALSGLEFAVNHLSLLRRRLQVLATTPSFFVLFFKFIFALKYYFTLIFFFMNTLIFIFSLCIGFQDRVSLCTAL